MGNGIAQVFAQAGFEVRLVDAAPGALDRARATIEKSLAKLVEKGRLSASDRNASLDRLSTGMNLDALTDVDYVVEAIFEMEQAKRELFARLDQLTRPEVILSSNTSSISITTLGAATNRADKVLGMINEQTKIIPGHGPLATPRDLKAFRDMLATLRENVAKLIREGKTLEQAIEAAPTKDLDAEWGDGFLKPEQIAQMVYMDLKRTVK